MVGGVACSGGGVWFQERLSDVTDWRGGVRVGHGDQELHVFFFFSTSSSFGSFSPASSCLQLPKWTVIGPGMVLLVLVGSGQVPCKAVQVLGQSLQGGGGRSLELCGIVTFDIWSGGYHGNGAGGGWGLSGPVTASITAGRRGQGGCWRCHGYHCFHSCGGHGFLGEGGKGPAHCAHATLPPPLALCVCVIGVRRQQVWARTPSASRTSAVLQVGRDQSQRTGPPGPREGEQTTPQVAMTTRGGESEGGEAELRADSQTEVF